MAFSVLCVSISDTLHHRVALIGNSFRPGNSLIVSHTRATYTGPPHVAAFTVVAALERKIRTTSVRLKQLISLTHARNQLSFVDVNNKFREPANPLLENGL